MRGTATLVLLALLGLAVPAWADPPAWAHASATAKTSVTKTPDGAEEIVVEVDGVKAGRRQVGKKVYDLVWERDPRALGLRHRLHAHEITKAFAPEKDPLPGGGNLVVGDAPAMLADTSVVVDVNYLYSGAAAARIGGDAAMPAFMALSCALATQSYANSGMANVRWRCLGPFKTTYTEATDGDALAWLGGAGASFVAAKYAQTGADVTSMTVGSIPGGWCGFAYLTSSASNALSVTDIGCANSNLSFPHECAGHNVGMNHDPANSGCTATSPTSGLVYCPGSYNYGHSFPIGAPLWRTIMAYPGAGGQRITQISNPAVLYQGSATGIPNERDNARVAVARAPVVAAFRTAVSPTTAPINHLR